MKADGLDGVGIGGDAAIGASTGMRYKESKTRLKRIDAPAENHKTGQAQPNKQENGRLRNAQRHRSARALCGAAAGPGQSGVIRLADQILAHSVSGAATSGSVSKRIKFSEGIKRSKHEEHGDQTGKFSHTSKKIFIQQCVSSRRH